MSDCDSRLAGNFARVCGHKPKQGIVRKWYINWDDIDRTGTITANRGTKCTALVLKAGKKIYAAEGNDKAHKGAHALAVNDFGNGYIHTDNFTVAYRGEDQRERIQEIVDGARVVTLIENVDTGVAGELTYDLLGLEAGMKVTEDNWSSSENSGTSTLTVATAEGEEEATGKKLFLMTAGLAATTTWITTNEYAEPEE